MAKEEKKSEALEKAKEVVSTLVGHLGVDAQAKMQRHEDEKTGKEVVKIEIGGDEELGRLIGRRGRSLESIQLVLSILVNKQLEEPVYVSLDINGYRAEREEKLRRMARKGIAEAKESGKVYEMPPMNAADRRIVHMEVAEDEEVESESVGKGAGRRVLIKEPGVEIDDRIIGSKELVDEEELEDYKA